MKISSWPDSGGERWNRAFANGYLPLGQSWEWGEAKRATGRHVARFMLGDELGVQFESRGGVAWAPGAPAGDIEDRYVQALRRLSARIRRPILLSPVQPLHELGPPVAVGMFHSGTVLFDLAGGEAEVRGRLRKTWRNSLSKGQRGAAEITDGSIDEMLDMLDELARRKRFEIPYEGTFVEALRGAFGDGFAIRVARHEGRTVAGRLDLRAGATATSFISATTMDGREIGASYLLTWDAVLRHQRAGATVYDLGGISAHRSSGTTAHKLSMGGEVVDYPGTYLIGGYAASMILKAYFRLRTTGKEQVGRPPAQIDR